MAFHFKCPDCNIDMSFDSNTGTLSCSLCGRKETIEQYQKNYASFDTVSYDAFYDDEEARQYLCRKCGAIFVTDNHTAISTCRFCNSPVTLGERISGDLAPAKIIPFRVSKADAAKAFQKWQRKLKFAPKEFAKKKKMPKVIGMYIPSYLFDLRGQGQATLCCTSKQTLHNENETVKQEKHYDIFRQVDLTFQNIMASSSQKVPAAIMEQLEPFDYSGMQDFNISFLADFLSEKYHFKREELFPRMQKRAKKYMDSYIENTVKDYDDFEFTERDYQVGELSSDYLLVPVWLVFYDGENADYIFAMNGQTGKMTGDLPVDEKIYRKWLLGMTIGFTALAYLVGMLIF